MFVKGEDIGLLLSNYARLAFHQRTQLKLAVLYLLDRSPVSVGIDEIQLMRIAVALQFQAENGASFHRELQTVPQWLGLRAIAR